MEKPTAYLMTGLPYAGKTTLANELARRFGMKVISIDLINDERGIGKAGEPITQEDWDTTYREAYKRVGQYLTQGHSIIFDATNFTRPQRDRIKALASSAGSLSRVIYVDTPEEECRARWLSNRQARERADVREDDFAQVVNNFEAPYSDENALTHSNSMDLDRWIDENIK